MEVITLQPAHAAIVDAVCLMTVVDGVLDPEEIAFLENMVMTMLSVDIDVAQALLQNSLDRLGNEDTEGFIQAIVDRLTEPVHRHACMVALQIASLADGVGADIELHMLDDFATRLELTDAEIEAAIAAARQLLATIEAAMGVKN